MIIISHLLCAIDFSDTSGYALQYAAEIARNRNAHLSIIYIDSTPDEMPPLRFERLQDEFEEWTNKSNLSDIKITRHILFGAPEKEILDFALKINADMIIIGNRSHGNMYDLFMGSVAKSIIQHSPRPVLLVKIPIVSA
ncbi:universal stress protein [Ferruginibacter paludis]|uniref:universal stress protein n=1 Tax=Ferruginibacter paludis TaxID=1310417 RepID=UPI0025B50D8C|nr:universal stress protein [Ferruginibacter paludis]MDN3656065.1 universal stress protein [Ferruginibacter paludis]